MITKTELKKIFKQNNIELIFRKENHFGKSEIGEHTIGVHKLVASLDEALIALEDAAKDNFPRVFIYEQIGLSKAIKDKYTKLINGKKWSKSDIHGLLKLINGRRFKKDLFKEDVNNLIALMWSHEEDNKEWLITKEQSDLGIQWLKNACFKKNGETRNTELSRSFSDHKKNIIKNFSKFRFVGFHEEGGGCYNTTYLPIYRTYDRKGNYFDYSPIHWGLPIIHN
jgi:hypothetical protein